MENVATKKVYSGGINIFDAVAIAGGSILSRQLLSRLIGSNNWISAGIKVAGATALNYMVKGKISSYASASLIIDGATDVANILLDMVGVKNTAKKNNKQDVL